MRVLISGGTGYVGQRLVSVLKAKHDEVAVLSRSPTLEMKDVLHCAYDGSGESVLRFLNYWKPSVVVHLAANLSKSASMNVVDELIDANVRLTAHLAQGCTDNAVQKFINISTYSTSLTGRFYQPQTLYAATKKAAEDILAFYHQSTEVNVCNLCFYDVYGPMQPHARLLNSIIDSIRIGEKVTLSPGRQEICYLYIDDAVLAISYCIDNERCFIDPVQNIFTVYGDEILLVNEVPDLVAKVLGVAPPSLDCSLSYRKNEIMFFRPPYARLPGWKPSVLLHDGLRSTIEGQF